MAFLKKSMAELQRLDAMQYKAADKSPIVVVLDQIRSQHNVGAVFRTADAFRVSHVYLCGFTPTPPHRDIHKTALGAEDAVPWTYVEQTSEAVRALKAEGYKVYAVEQVHNSESLLEWVLTPPVALVLGNEVQGVADEVLALVDGCIEIPQAGTKHSLNIGTSAGIVLWEAYRQLRMAT